MRPHLSFSSAACVLFATISTASHRHLHQTLSPRTQCYSGVFTIVSRGSEEPQGQSILEGIASAIAAAIPGSGSDEIVYPATLSFWDSAPTGVDDAQQQMQDYATQCPEGKMILLGYSQGSFVLATALAGGNFSDQSWPPIADDVGANVAAIVLFGDPNRVLGQGTAAIGTNCAETCTATAPLALTSPYSSSMAAYSDRLEHWCEANDPICCKTGKDIQAHLSYWSNNTTDTVVQFVQSKLGNDTTGASSTASSSSAASSATSSSSLPPASSSAASSSALSVASSVESAVSTKSAELAAATGTSATESGVAATTQVPTSPTASVSPSASTASTSDGSRRSPLTLAAAWSTLLCAATFSLRALL